MTASLWSLVADQATTSPEAPMAADEHGRTLTFAALHDHAERVAAALADHGVGPTTVVSWQLPNCFEAVVLAAALARLGAIQNPLVPMLREREVRFITSQAGTDLLVVPDTFRGFDHAAMAAAIAADRRDVDVLVVADALPDGDPARLPGPPSSAGQWLFYTSGTTSEPKGARHTDAALVASSRSVTTALRVTADDVITLLAPVAHIGGISHVVSSLRTGCRLVVSATFDAETSPPFLRRQDPTLVGSGVPFIRAYLAYQRAHPDERPLFPRARAFLCGGSPRPAGLQEEVRAELGGVGVVSGYGLTECPNLSWTSIDDADADRASTEGQPAEGVEVVVVDGELRVRGPQLMTGYVDAALDADAFDDDGYFRTGDLGEIDERGYLRVTGRLKDLIIRNMENVAASEVEEAILGHPAVGDVAVLGVPDPTTGERVCAVVVPADADRAPTLLELSEHLTAAGLNRRKHPEQLVVVAALPRNAMGKVVKPELRRQLGLAT